MLHSVVPGDAHWSRHAQVQLPRCWVALHPYLTQDSWPPHAGVKVGAHHVNFACDPDTLDRSAITEADEQLLRKFLARFIPGAEWGHAVRPFMHMHY